MTNNKQQTAVDWLVEKMLTQDWYTYKSLEYIKKAKEMEKDQHIKSWEAGLMKVDFNEYYKQTYGGGEQ